ncbi:endonuclease domain-containing protein [Leucobacter triazinivorans]|uniref:DUF559 domain-containing protein n=1 Tax=Leucobacter triazinivorans TaxID=1784719 RepID=A0A4P6KFV3_9MICO|nr:DUF559 domain-containing protein [Leucobacter triazinivorans]QBE49365.1 DUF559 domain-containing protein [Leucobacter triazinivorans]
MSIFQELHALGGITQTSRLVELGHTHYRIRKAFASGDLTRPRRGWIALRSADPQLLFAARHGVALTCITQAKRWGLWVFEHDRPHVAAPGGRHVDLAGKTVHRRRPLVLRPPGTLADGVENMLDCVAACQPHDAALAVWDSALQKRLIDFEALAALPLRGNARALLAECSPFADSGLETFFRTRLRWLRIPIRQQIWIHGHRVDFLVGDRLVVQLDGRDHSGAQRSEDNRHDAALIQRGYHVIRVSYAQLVYSWPEVQDAVLGAIARGLHHAR